MSPTYEESFASHWPSFLGSENHKICHHYDPMSPANIVPFNFLSSIYLGKTALCRSVVGDVYVGNVQL